MPPKSPSWQVRSSVYGQRSYDSCACGCSQWLVVASPVYRILQRSYNSCDDHPADALQNARRSKSGYSVCSRQGYQIVAMTNHRHCEMLAAWVAKYNCTRAWSAVTDADDHGTCSSCHYWYTHPPPAPVCVCVHAPLSFFSCVHTLLPRLTAPLQQQQQQKAGIKARTTVCF